MSSDNHETMLDDHEKNQLENVIRQLNDLIFYVKANNYYCDSATLDQTVETLKTPSRLIPDDLTITLKLDFKKLKIG